MTEHVEQRPCLRQPIPEIEEAAQSLRRAVSAHLVGDFDDAAKLFAEANNEAIRDWTDSIWGKTSPCLQFRPIDGAPVCIPKDQRAPNRMPSMNKRRAIHARDGHYCRFCGIPVIRREIRTRLRRFYPEAISWGRTNRSQHAAFQAMCANYDHILPHARGGGNDLNNIVLTCAPCNYGRMDFVLEELGLADPRMRQPRSGSWDGLERILDP